MPAVLFADVSGWTDLTSRVGDSAALTLRDGLFGPLKEIIQKNKGWLVKTLGDELMCLFGSAQEAARAACDMQLHAERANSVASEPLPLRIGMHAGQVVVKDNDIEGNTVNVAARVAAASKPERILMTRAAAERLNEDFSELLRQWRNEAFKGKTETFELFELNWRKEPEERTIVSRTAENAGTKFKSLTLRCQGKVCVLEVDGKAVTFGRSRHNTLSIADPGHFVSGNHGKIEIRGGSVVLTDNSRNGIFVSFGQGRYFLVDKLLVLRNSGRMALGRAPDESGTVIAEFELEADDAHGVMSARRDKKIL